MIETLRGLHVVTAKTNRAAQNWVYYADATAVLGIGPDATAEARAPFLHLVNWDVGNRGVRGAIKIGVLAEIGRIARQFGPDIARTLAKVTNDAIADGRIRSARDAELRLRSARMQLVADAKSGAK